MASKSSVCFKTEIQIPMASFAVTGEECPVSTGKARQDKEIKIFFHAEKSLEKFIWGESK